jgi:hypothetical protein
MSSEVANTPGRMVSTKKKNGKSWFGNEEHMLNTCPLYVLGAMNTAAIVKPAFPLIIAYCKIPGRALRGLQCLEQF